MVGKAIVRSELIPSFMVRFYISGISDGNAYPDVKPEGLDQKERKYV